MKSIKHLFVTGLSLAALTAGAWAQTQTAMNSGPEKPSAAAAPAIAQPPVTGADIQALKDALAAQQKQIAALQAQLAARNGDQPAPAQPAQPATQPAQMVATDNGITIQQEVPQAGTATQEVPSKNPMEGPISIHFRGITVTPGGFAAAEFVRRSRALATDVATPFNSLTMPGASQSTTSEFFGSARQSRPTVYVSGRLGSAELSSYVSTDFLSSGTTSSATQTNSYTLRLRQAWGQAKFDNGWSIVGGQMWSLVTENRNGISPSDDTGRYNDARPSTIDSTYNVGFTFARQYAIRVTKDFGDKVWFAVSMENPQATLTSHGNASNYLLGEAGATSNYNSLSNYAFNPSPDIIAKVAFEPGFGHYEIFGLFDRFRDRVFPCIDTYTPTGGTAVVGPQCPSAADAGTADAAFNSSKNGGGIGANARWTFANKHIVFGLHGFGGSGVGRYGAAQLSDVAVKANGELALIKGYQGLSTLEYRGKKLDLYTYAGAEYASRTADFDPLGSKGAGAQVGYGAPGFTNTGCYSETAPGSGGYAPGSLSNCTADTKVVIEGTAGFWYRFYNGPRGKFQFGTQYSYVTRNTWSGSGGLAAGTAHGDEPHGIDNMIFTSFRYYLP